MSDIEQLFAPLFEDDDIELAKWRELVGTTLADVINGVEDGSIPAPGSDPEIDEDSGLPVDQWGPPPAPVSFDATATFDSVILEWVLPAYATHAWVKYSQIYRGTVDNIDDVGTELVVTLDNNMNTVVSTRIFTDNPPNPAVGATYYYWLKFISAAGIDGPLFQQAGVDATLPQDPTYMLEQLAESIGYDVFDVANGVFPVRMGTILPDLPDADWPPGSIFYDIDEGADGKMYRTEDGTSWKSSLDGTDLDSGSVGSDGLATGSVLEAKLAANAVTTAKVASGAITATEIGPDAVTTAKIFAGAVTAGEIATNTITANEIAAGAINASELNTNAVTAIKINASAITSGKIAASAILATHIGTNEIIANSANIKNGVIVEAKIGTAAITEAKIGNLAVSTAKIQSAAITEAKIGNLAVDTAHIKDASVETLKIGLNQVTIPIATDVGFLTVDFDAWRVFVSTTSADFIGQPVSISVTGTILAVNASGGTDDGAIVFIRLQRSDGEMTSSRVVTNIIIPTGSSPQYFPVIFNFTDSPPAGSYAYTAEIFVDRIGTSSNFFVSRQWATMLALGLKR